MGVQIVWRVPERREVEIALYVWLRMVHVAGWRRLVICCPLTGATFAGIELAEQASEADARDWARLFDRRYRTTLTLDDLLQDPARFTELYIDGGVGAFLRRYEDEQARAEALRRRAREERR